MSAIQYTISINSLVLEIIQNSFLWNFTGKFRIYHLNFSPNSNFQTVGNCDADFMTMKSLKIHKGFDREKLHGWNVSPQTIFHAEIPYRFSNFELS